MAVFNQVALFDGEKLNLICHNTKKRTVSQNKMQFKDTINKIKGVMLMTFGQDVAPLICGATGLPCCECMPCCSNRTLAKDIYVLTNRIP